MRLSISMTKWLKCLHLLAVTGWVGGAISLLILHFLRFKGVESGNELYGIDRAAHLIDMGVVVILGAFGCLLTGLLYSALTNWGFFRHRWVLIKWIITIFCILSGTFLLGPWETTMLNISHKFGDTALEIVKYNSSMYLNFWFGVLQLILLIFAMFISVFKPRLRKMTNLTK
ncbi:MAG: hypothetical protein FWG02_05780 [Holophagaceae bacterium]|nr:hypothetical protein [Holophagaceae bacterium]